MKELGPDNIKMRNYIYPLINIAEAKSMLDIGCGDGYDLVTMYIYVGRKR